jgi:hypothetical protein
MISKTPVRVYRFPTPWIAAAAGCILVCGKNSRGISNSGGSMKPRVWAVLASGLVALGTGLPAWAHHSFSASYDTTAPVEVHGVITEVLLRNPHSWFRLEVKNASGKVEEWSFEAGTPSGMIRNGYKPDVIKKGAEVTIKGFHARDLTQTRGMLSQLITSDGHVYGMFGPQEGPGK